MKKIPGLLLIVWIVLAGCQQGGNEEVNGHPEEENAVVDSDQHNGNNKTSHRKRKNNTAGREHAGTGGVPDNTVAPRNDPAGLDRDPSRIVYSKHARCRMACRHIDESEVQEILLQGRINERKSEPAGRPDPKYALEGTTRDGQEVRIVFAMAKRGIVVVTVIDLGREWACDCK